MDVAAWQKNKRFVDRRDGCLLLLFLQATICLPHTHTAGFLGIAILFLWWLTMNEQSLTPHFLLSSMP
jgi:hypothetical protein